MKSISGKYWEEIKTEKRLVDKVKVDHNLNTFQAKLIINRNFTEEELLSINNNISLKNPFIKTKDFLSACELLELHITKKNKILIIGDYDVDGCLSTVLMVNFLKKNQAKVKYFIPDRLKDGYGASEKLIRKLISFHKPELIIFLDCGSSSYNAIKFINSKNISSLIIDHHNINKPYPSSDIIINPKKICDYNKYDYLCTVFLTYLFIDLYIKKNKLKISIKDNQIYVLIATVADVMPIRGINRFLALNVINNFDVNKNFILSNLFNLLNIKKKLELDDLAYLIAPILNSAGRLSNANQIVELFTTQSDDIKVKILKKIFDLNQKRKLIEKKFLLNFQFNDLDKLKGVLFIYEPNIPEGIIGIIASRIKDYYNRPCVVLTNSNDIIKGSARSTLNFDIGKFINNALDEKIILSGGGHNLAAGVSLLKSKIEIFKKFINKYYEKNTPSLINYYTSKIFPNSINKKLINEINILGPFGNKNVNPIFLIENVKIVKPKIVKERFISCFIKYNNKFIKAMSFNHLNTKISYELLNSKNNFDILLNIKENKWNNKSKIEVEIIDLIKNINKT